jgi:hypothetical protein
MKKDVSFHNTNHASSSLYIVGFNIADETNCGFKYENKNLCLY